MKVQHSGKRLKTFKSKEAYILRSQRIGRRYMISRAMQVVSAVYQLEHVARLIGAHGVDEPFVHRRDVAAHLSEAPVLLLALSAEHDRGAPAA